MSQRRRCTSSTCSLSATRTWLIVPGASDEVSSTTSGWTPLPMGWRGPRSGARTVSRCTLSRRQSEPRGWRPSGWGLSVLPRAVSELAQGQAPPHRRVRGRWLALFHTGQTRRSDPRRRWRARRGGTIGLPESERSALVKLLRRYGRQHPTGAVTIPKDCIVARVSYTFHAGPRHPA